MNNSDNIPFCLAGVEVAIDDLARAIHVPGSELTTNCQFRYAYMDNQRRSIVFVYEHPDLETLGTMRLYAGEILESVE